MESTTLKQKSARLKEIGKELRAIGCDIGDLLIRENLFLSANGCDLSAGLIDSNIENTMELIIKEVDA